MAILLRDRLAAKGYRVFLDIESLNSGSFNKKLLEVIENCTDVVVVCSKGSLDRCVNEGDWVRTEIVHALKHGKNVVPVMLRGFEWPDVLPDDMEELRMQNGVNANSHEYFDAAIDRLAEKFLQSQSHSSEAKKPSSPKPLVKKTKGIIIGAASLLVVIALVVGGITLFGDKGGADDPGNTDVSQGDGGIREGANTPANSESNSSDVSAQFSQLLLQVKADDECLVFIEPYANLSGGTRDFSLFCFFPSGIAVEMDGRGHKRMDVESAIKYFLQAYDGVPKLGELSSKSLGCYAGEFLLDDGALRMRLEYLGEGFSPKNYDCTLSDSETLSYEETTNEGDSSKGYAKFCGIFKNGEFQANDTFDELWN
jgi:hypothetical protein